MPGGVIVSFDQYRAHRLVRWIDVQRQRFRARFHRKFREDLALLGAFLPEDGVYFDVGANHGRVSLELSRQHGGRCQVYAFEPLPYNLRVLEALVGSRPNVKAMRKALSDRPGRMDAYVPVRGRGRVIHGDTFLATAEDHARLEQAAQLYLHAAIETTTMDAYVEAEAVERVDFVKLDVQGHEEAVLRGASRTLETWHPSLLMEVATWAEGGRKHDPEGPLRLLAAKGYRFYDLDLRDDGDWTDEVAKIARGLTHGGKGHHDVICFHPQGPVGADPPPFLVAFGKTRFGP